MLTILFALLAPAAFAAPSAPATQNGPVIMDAVQPLLALDGQLRANVKKEAMDESFKEELPLTNGKSEAVLDKLPLAPSDE